MAGTFQICGKGALKGNKVSHANNKTKKMSKPNVQSVKALGPHGSHVRINVCTRCIRSGKVEEGRMIIPSPCMPAGARILPPRSSSPIQRSSAF